MPPSTAPADLMPGANASLTAVGLPALAERRRAWAFPDLQSHSLIVLTNDQLHLAPLTGSPKPEVVSAAEAGLDLGELLGPLAVVVDLSAVRAVKHDLLANALVIEYDKRGPGVARLTVVFAAAEAADACFTKVWRRLSGRFALQPYKRDAWAAARAPLALLLGALLATAALALAISAFEDTAPARAARLAVETGEPEAAAGAAKEPPGPLSRLGWRGVCALGGTVAAGAQVWLYRRLTGPPERLKLVRT